MKEDIILYNDTMNKTYDNYLIWKTIFKGDLSFKAVKNLIFIIVENKNLFIIFIPKNNIFLTQFAFFVNLILSLLYHTKFEFTKCKDILIFSICEYEKPILHINNKIYNNINFYNYEKIKKSFK